MEENTTYSGIPIFDMLAKGKLPTVEIGFERQTLIDLGALLVIAFIIIGFFAAAVYSKFKCE